jgi:hypothetical protein
MIKPFVLLAIIVSPLVLTPATMARAGENGFVLGGQITLRLQDGKDPNEEKLGVRLGAGVTDADANRLGGSGLNQTVPLAEFKIFNNSDEQYKTIFDLNKPLPCPTIKEEGYCGTNPQSSQPFGQSLPLPPPKQLPEPTRLPPPKPPTRR